MSRQDDIKKLIVTYNRRLQKLQEQRALHGLNTAPEVQIEIEDIEAQLKTLKMALKSLQSGVEPDLSTEIEQELARMKIEAQPRSQTQIGGINITGVSEGTINIQGDIDTSVKAEGDIVLGNQETHIHYHGVEEPKALEKPLQPFEPELVEIPSGSFLMGSQHGADIPNEETPQHKVDLGEYRISKYPITNAQYAEFIKRTPSSEQDVPQQAGWFLREPPADKLNHPVVGVSWYDAQAYCRWLNQETGRTYRLPTEAEWEKAASWTGEEKTQYPWGNKFDADRANTSEAGLKGTTPVDAYSPQGDSAYGCADMSGNVQEWTTSLWGNNLRKSDFPYPYQSNDGREDVADNQHLHQAFFIHRGGSFRNNQNRVRTTARGRADPRSKINKRGFRVVLESQTLKD